MTKDNEVKIFVYCLFCNDNKYYTGLTKDINRRFREHQSGQSKSTKYKLPVLLVFLTIKKSYKAARRLEVEIKNMGAEKFIFRDNFNSVKYNMIH